MRYKHQFDWFIIQNRGRTLTLGLEARDAVAKRSASLTTDRADALLAQCFCPTSCAKLLLG